MQIHAAMEPLIFRGFILNGWREGSEAEASEPPRLRFKNDMAKQRGFERQARMI
jgi:hypothetical protein